MIKRLYDYTNAELLALDAEGILRLKDQECMLEGAPLLPDPPGPEPSKPRVVGEQLAYRVSAETTFFNEADAQEVLALIRSKARGDAYYLSGSWNGPQGIKTEDPHQGSLTTERYWTPDQWTQHKADQEAYQSLKSAWDAHKREYDKAEKARQKAVERVSEALEQAHEAARTAQSIRDTFERYVDLSDGNRDVAIKFMYQFDGWTEDAINKVLGLAQYAPVQEVTSHGQAE
ncbi:MAG: hypothetical protein H7831_10160 [Magnetococcus sp. WYHC-3]